MNIEINGRYFMPHDYDNEEWRRIKGFRRYLISNYCRIKNKVTDQILKPQIGDRKTKRTVYTIRVNNDQETKVVDLTQTVKAMPFSFKVYLTHNKEGFLTYKKSDEYIYGAF